MKRYAGTFLERLPSQDESESTFEIEVQHFEIEFLQFRKVFDQIIQISNIFKQFIQKIG